MFIFVSDFHAAQVSGGAELTTDAIFQHFLKNGETCAFVLSSELSEEILDSYSDKHFILTNCTKISTKLFPRLIKTDHTVIEYDYKFCKFRSPHIHNIYVSQRDRSPLDLHRDCNCKKENDAFPLWEALFQSARNVFFMSEEQKRIIENQIELDPSRSHVLSSVFEESSLDMLEEIRKNRTTNNGKFAVLDSSSPIKGTRTTCEILDKHGIPYEKIGGLEPHDFLTKLSEFRGLAFAPLGGDTCPRIVIEAKLMGLELMINDNVQHAKEFWFDTDDTRITRNYLYSNADSILKKCKEHYDKNWKISGYTTTRNCIDQKYPFKESIASLLEFCDEVVVADCGSTDGTLEWLVSNSLKDKKLKVYQFDYSLIDSSISFGLFDGMSKAFARSKCTNPWLWQSDVDEIAENIEKISPLIKSLPSHVSIYNLPVVEFWGNKGKVRIDATPWKWRISRNLEHITHGAPIGAVYIENGVKRLRQGTDGCDYIDKNTGQPIVSFSYYTPDRENARCSSLLNPGRSEQVQEKITQEWAGFVRHDISSLPFVAHYSWWDLPRKIRAYKNFWQKHWSSMYGLSQEDTAENNMFFDKPWSEVTEEDIENLAERLERELGGHIFHKKINWSAKTPHIDEISLGISAKEILEKRNGS